MKFETKLDIEGKLVEALSVVWTATFTIGSVTALVAITKLFLSVVGVI